MAKAKVVGIADEPPDRGITADEWCRYLIDAVRPLFRRAHWPLPGKATSDVGAAGVRARSDSAIPKHYKVAPHTEQADRFFVIRFPATEPTSEAIARQIFVGLTHVAVAETLVRRGVPYESVLMHKGDLYKTVRMQSGLLDDYDSMTKIALAITTQQVTLHGPYPEGPSNRRPKSKMPDTISVQCNHCGIVWITNWSKVKYEEARSMGGLRCPCSGVLVDTEEAAKIFRFGRS